MNWFVKVIRKVERFRKIMDQPIVRCETCKTIALKRFGGHAGHKFRPTSDITLWELLKLLAGRVK